MKMKHYLLTLLTLVLLLGGWQNASAQFSTDVSATGVTPAAGTICDGSYPVTVFVTNLDAVNPTNGPVPVQYYLDGALVSAGTTTGPLAGGGSELVILGVFGNKPGTHNISAVASYVGDTNPLDNGSNSTVVVQFNGVYTVGSAPTDHFATFKAAIDTLNTYGVCGPTTINVAAAFAETAPAGGYVIGGATSLLITTLNSTNTLTFNGNLAVLTASAALTVGSASDAIVKLVGVDYVTISGFSLLENAANVNTVLATNTMTEFGVGIFGVSVTDGAQNNTIQNNIISLGGATYQNTMGVLSTCASTYLLANADATASSGTNSYNKFYSNTINGVAYGMYFISPLNTSTITETGIDVGGSMLSQGNSITFGNPVTATFSSLYRFSATLPAAVYFRNGGTGSNVSYNTIVSNSVAYAQSGGVGGIINTAATAPAAGITYTSTRLFNNITLNNTGTTAMMGIDFGNGLTTATLSATDNTIVLNQGTTAAASATLTGIKASYTTLSNTINSNTITVNQSPITAGSLTSPVTGINAAGAGTTVNVNTNIVTIKQNAPGGTATYGSGAITFISVAAASGTVSVNSNKMLTTGSNIRSTGDVYGINHSAAFTVGININSNEVSFDRLSASGFVYLTYTNSISNAGYCNYANNKFSNISVAGTTTLNGFQNTDGGTGTAKTITGNKFSNFTAATGPITAINITYWNGVSSMSNDTISSITGQGSVTGINIGSSANNATSINVSNNIISGLSSTGVGGSVSGITCSNTSTSISLTGNVINNLSSTGASNVQGIVVSGANNTSVSKNRIFNLSGTNALSAVYGISITGGTTISASNNFISELNATLANAATPVIGINVSGGTTANLYHNTVYLNATSSGALFGSSAIYASTTPTLNMINNIFVNASTPNGATGYTSAYRRSTTTLTTYGSSSDNNFFYAGTPGTNNLIFFDGTNSDQDMTTYLPRVATRDAASITGTAPFVNIAATPYDLHIQTTVATGIESGGKVVASVTTDYDGDSRNATTPDMGADEFAGIPNYTCALPTPGNTIASNASLCFGESTSLSLQNATAGTGVSYQWQSSTDGITYNNIGGAISSTYSVTPSAATYYQCIVTCVNGPVSGTSTPVFINFTHSVTSSSGASRCGSGTLSLTASGSAGTTLNWYAAATGGAAIGTGSPWTTPIISSTTNYYVGAEVVSSANITLGAGALSGSTNPYNPFNGGYGGEKAQYLIKASELISAGVVAGNINSLTFYATVLGTTYNGFYVEMGTTALADFTSTANIQGGLTTVYTAASITPVVGANTITFSTPFLWDGTSNIIVSTSWSNNNTSNTSLTVTYDNSSFYASQCYRKDSETAANLFAFTGATGAGTYSFSSTQSRPRFTFNAATSCSSPRVAVAATIGASPALTITGDQDVCNNAGASISVTSTLADYDSYVWTPATNLFTDAGCTTPYVGGNSATTVFVKSSTPGVVTYTCTANNTSTLCSNIATTDVNVLPGIIIVSATPASICNSGTSVLSVAPATGFGSATFQWMSSTDNVTFSDIVGAEAISYTTPTINDTMYYKMVVELGVSFCTESDTASVFVNVPSIVSTTPASICGDGTVTLNATGSVGSTLSWYSAASGGSSIGSGSPWTTPTISATTNYYVAAEILGALTTQTIGAGASTSSATYTPFNGSYGGIKSQHLFTSAELIAAGLSAGEISSIALDVTVAGTTYNGFTIQVGNTLLSNFTATPNIQGGLTTVYSAASATPTVGINTYNFSTPFIWDGSSNIIVSISWSNSNTFNTSATVKVDGTTNYSSQSYRKDSDTPANILAFTGATGTLASSQNRPQMRFGNTSVCASSRSTVVATVNTAPALTAITATPAIICQGDSTDLEATSTNAGYDYVWTGSLSGATQTVSPTATTTYSVTATDNSGGANDGCVATGDVLVTVNPVPTAVSASASDSSICIGATINLFSTANAGTSPAVFYSESFENTGAIPSGWAADLDVDGNATNAAITFETATTFPSGFSATDGTFMAKFNSYDVQSGNSARLRTSTSFATTSMIDIKVNFDWLNSATYTNKDYLMVEYSTDGSTWVEASDTIFRFDATAHWSSLSVDLPAAANNQSALYIAFKFVSAYGNNCFLDNVEILGSDASLNYSWTSAPVGYTSASPNPTAVTPSATTDYIVTVENVHGCTASDAVTVNVGTYPVVNLGVDQVICDTTSITLDAGNAGSTFDWSTGGSSQTEVFNGSAGAGVYDISVEVTNAAGCATSDTVTITVTICTGIEDPAVSISIYPNPATDYLNLDLSQLSNGDYTFELMSMTGQQILKHNVINDGTVISVSLSDVAPGTYVVRLSGNNNSFQNFINIIK